MPLYGISTVPLIKQLQTLTKTQQVWYADDSSAAGTLSEIHNWWENLCKLGPSFGYHVNSSKTWLVTKKELEPEARRLFMDSNIQMTTEGRPYLGSPIGSEGFTTQWISAKVNTWLSTLSTLNEVAASSPHAAYAALTHGISSQWGFVCRTTPDIHHHLQPLEDLIRCRLIPTLTGNAPPNDNERCLFGLPTRLGGLNLPSPVSQSMEYKYSKSLTSSLVSLILEQTGQFSWDICESQKKLKSSIKRDKMKASYEQCQELLPHLPDDLQYAITLAQEKGASSWLSSLPLLEHNFTLHKGAFRDALALRYGWIPAHFPTECICGLEFSVEHALSCKRGGFPTLRHNEVRDLTATLLTEVCPNVEVEPSLQELSGETLPLSANSEDGARADVAMDGFWERGRARTFCDIRVFNPLAPSNKKGSISASYRAHEKEKKRQYNQRINQVEHGSFQPIVLSSTGGMGKETTVFFKRLASLLSEKWDQQYSITLGWIRSTLSFSLLRSSIQCLRGARSKRGRPDFRPVLPEVVQSETFFEFE